MPSGSTCRRKRITCAARRGSPAPGAAERQRGLGVGAGRIELGGRTEVGVLERGRLEAPQLVREARIGEEALEDLARDAVDQRQALMALTRVDPVVAQRFVDDRPFRARPSGAQE
jgi:hypothetical protein